MSELTTNSAQEPVLERRKPGEPRVLSLAQQRLWYVDQVAPGLGVYNIPYLMKIRGPLNCDALRKAYDAVIGRHEGLRTVFLAPSGTPMPFALKKWAIQIREQDLRQIPEHERKVLAEKLIREEAGRPFHLGRDLMMRGLLLRMSHDEHWLLQVSHHIASEAGSLPVLFHELGQFYPAFCRGETIELPVPPFQYSDFALWQRRYLQGERLEKLQIFWRQKLGGAEQIQLPTDRPRPPVPSQKGERYPIHVPIELLRQFRDLSATLKISPYRSMMAVFNVFLHAWTGQEDFSLGSPVLPKRVSVEGMIGFFVNTLVFRNDLSGDPTFRELMARVDESVRRSVEHSDLTFDKIVDAVQPPRDPSRNPLFQVNFRSPKAPLPAPHIEGLEISIPEYRDNGTAKFDLAFELQTQDGEGSYFEYASDLFDERTIHQMTLDYEAVLRDLVTNPDVRLSQLSSVAGIRTRVREKYGH